MVGMGTRTTPPPAHTRPGKGGKGSLRTGGSKSRSTLSRAERREAGFKMIAKGYTNVEIAKALEVHPDTVTRIRRKYEEQLANEAAANPALLHDVLTNTVRMIAELDMVRREAWDALESGAFYSEECPECGHETVHWRSHKGDAKPQYMRILLTAVEQKSKLYQLFGVKAEFLAHVNQVAQLQTRLIGFMRDSLCDEDRARLEELLVTMTGAVESTDTVATLELPAAG